jgi:hypothetical protein
MSNEDQINDTYKRIKRKLPMRIQRQLEFRPPKRLTKEPLRICRGRIYGTSRNHIWNPKWCFYEIGIGHYPDAPWAVGAIGFVAYPNNPLCGGGKYATILRNFLKKAAESDIKFRLKCTNRGTLTLFTYYKPSASSSFPSDSAAAALAKFISNSFDDFDKLVV